jgi:hypothetical protein
VVESERAKKKDKHSNQECIPHIIGMADLETAGQGIKH